MTGPESLGGALRLRPGRPTPNIVSTRALLARTLLRGRPAEAAPELLSAVFSACGGAHRLVAQAAIAAARGHAGHSDGFDSALLQRETLREHLRRIWLDWPRALAGSAAGSSELAALRDCPVLRPSAGQARWAGAKEAMAATRAWIAVNLIDAHGSQWLEAWSDDPRRCLSQWCERADTLPARALARCRDAAQALGAPARPLQVAASESGLIGLARWLRAEPRFALAPQLQGGPYETGPWTRLADPAVQRLDDAWLRLGARLAEVVRLGQPDAPERGGAHWLRHGALTLAAGEGLAWCEMARGLLVHRVALEPAADEGKRIAEYDVLAPTEWNFHPEGPVARLLAQLPPDAPDATLHLLAAAFDPCVTIEVERDDA